MQTDLNETLFNIIDAHIFQNPKPDEKTVILIVDEYMAFLSEIGIFVPHALKEIFVGDLKEEVREMTFKRTYGKIKI